MPNPGPAFKEVWQVKVWPKGLGQAKNLVGVYRLCLTEKTVNFVKLNSDAAAVVLQLMNVRRCGHSENFFFVEVGRSAVTGPGEFWMQVRLNACADFTSRVSPFFIDMPENPKGDTPSIPFFHACIMHEPILDQVYLGLRDCCSLVSCYV